MRRAVEKLCWLLLSLWVASLIAFAALARLSDVRMGRVVETPLFVNGSPRNARDLSLAAASVIASGRGDTTAAARELERLGGAALPHVLPSLDSLPPEARRRVAEALVPVARRIGVAEPRELATAELALVHFTRFWQERSADFRAASVRRKVARLAERALPLREKEVIELDNFALYELVHALGKVESTEDVARVRRLAPVLEHISGGGLAIPASADLPTTADAVLRVKRWFREHGSDYLNLDGPGRLVRFVTETRYFRWLATLFDALRGDDALGARKLDVVLEASAKTLPRGLFALFAGLGVAGLVTRLALGAPQTRRTIRLVALALAAVPLAFLGLSAAGLGTAPLTISLALGVAAVLVLHLTAEPIPETIRAVLGRAALPFGMLAGATYPALLAGEAASSLGGLGPLTRRGVLDGDLETLMLVALATGGTGLVLAALSLFASRTARGAAPSRHATLSRRRLWGVLGCFAALGAFALASPTLGIGPESVAAALGASLVAIALATLAAGGLGFALGLIAGLISRATALVLTRAFEVVCALPNALVLGAVLTYGGLVAALVLGGLRGVELGYLFWRKLADARAGLDLEPGSVGRAPLMPQITRLLPRAAGAPLVELALSGAWLSSLEFSALALGAPAPTSLVGLASSPAVPPVLAALALAAIVGALFFLRGASRAAEEAPFGAPLVIELRRLARPSEPPRSAPEADARNPGPHEA